MMMAANLIGFVVGTDGLKYIIHQVFDTWQSTSASLAPGPGSKDRIGIRFLLFSCVCIFVAIQVMFEYRCVLPWTSVPDRAN